MVKGPELITLKRLDCSCNCLVPDPTQFTQEEGSLVPRSHPKNRERDLVSLANFLVCAESAYYVEISEVYDMHMYAREQGKGKYS